MEVAIKLLPAQDVTTRLDELARCYPTAYPVPAGEGARYAEGLQVRAACEGFRFCAALDDVTGAAIGFAAGFTGQPGQMWRDWMVAALGPELAEQWLIGHFEFARFGVIPAWRQRGIGAQLHDALFTDLPHRRAILTVRTKQQPARGFYERRGWITLHPDFVTPTGGGPYAIMGCELKGEATPGISGA